MLMGTRKEMRLSMGFEALELELFPVWVCMPTGAKTRAVSAWVSYTNCPHINV